MKVYHGLENFDRPDYAVVTSGTFDGLHIGHQKILQRLTQIAQSQNAQSVVITFFPHPRLVLNEKQTLGLLTSLDEKIALLEKIGIDRLLIIPFDKEFSQYSSQKFIDEILIQKVNTKKLVIGYDHRFGKNREGSFEYLQANAANYGFEIEEISRQDIDEVAVSSTKIRQALSEGKVDSAANYLGRAYSFTGTVVEGDRLGREIGFPTANLQALDTYKLIPADGVYAVRVKIGSQEGYKAMLYIGRRSTIGENLQRNIEVNIFDFDADIYGKQISVDFIKLIRNDRKFENLAEMRVQLLADKVSTLEILR